MADLGRESVTWTISRGILPSIGTRPIAVRRPWRDGSGLDVATLPRTTTDTSTRRSIQAADLVARRCLAC